MCCVCYCVVCRFCSCFLFFAAGWLPFVGWLLGGFLVSGVCFAGAPSRGVLFSLLWSLALLRWCGWVFCVRLVVHSLFGFVTMLRFFSVLHIGLPLLAFRAGGGFLCPGVVVLSCFCWCVGYWFVWWGLRARLCVVDSLVFRVVWRCGRLG